MTAVTWTAVVRAVAARRRLVAACLAALAVAFGLAAIRPPAPATVAVLVAARELAPGTILALADIRSVELPAAAIPAGALRPGATVLGRRVAGAVRRGEPLTDVRLLGPALLAASGAPPGAVAVPVRFADASAAALVQPGERIDILASATDVADPVLASGPPARASPSEPATVVATDVVVLAVASPDLGTPESGDGALVVVACSPAVARVLAAAAVIAALSPVLRAP